MKQGTLVNRIVMLSLLGAILIYLGVYIYRAFTDPYPTVLSYDYTVDETMEATGFLARSETVISGVGGIVDPLVDEGEKVARGQAVAAVYQSQAAEQRRQQIQALELELEQLEYARDAGGSAAGSAQISGEIVDALAALRASAASGDLTRLEDQSLALKSLVYKREAAFGTGSTGAEGVSAAIQDVQGQIDALNAQAAQDTSRVTAQQAGIFSAQVDGYEGLLTPEGLEALSPTDLDGLAAQSVSGDGGAVGKLITDSTWYFICPLTEEQAKRLTEGSTVQVRFSRDWSGQVPMTVERISAPEEGRVAVILSSTRFLSDTTLLRRQTVEIVFSSQSGIRVPKAAIRVDKRQIENEDTGEIETEDVTGVYALVGGRAEFKPVTVLAQREDYCLVEPMDDKVKTALRAGDEIIIASAEIFDGMVIA